MTAVLSQSPQSYIRLSIPSYYRAYEYMRVFGAVVPGHHPNQLASARGCLHRSMLAGRTESGHRCVYYVHILPRRTSCTVPAPVGKLSMGILALAVKDRVIRWFRFWSQLFSACGSTTGRATQSPGYQSEWKCPWQSLKGRWTTSCMNMSEKVRQLADRCASAL